MEKNVCKECGHELEDVMEADKAEDVADVADEALDADESPVKVVIKFHKLPLDKMEKKLKEMGGE